VSNELNLILVHGGDVDAVGEIRKYSLNSFASGSPYSVATVISGGGSAHRGSIHIFVLTTVKIRVHSI